MAAFGISSGLSMLGAAVSMGLAVRRKRQERNAAAAAMEARVNTRERPQADKPFDSLDAYVDKEWCIGCDDIKAAKEFGWTKDHLHRFCADCRTDYDDPNSVLNPRPAVVVQTQVYHDEIAVLRLMCFDCGKDIETATVLHRTSGEPLCVDCYGKHDDIETAMCSQCGDFVYSEDEIPKPVVCYECRKTTDLPWEITGAKTGGGSVVNFPVVTLADKHYYLKEAPATHGPTCHVCSRSTGDSYTTFEGKPTCEHCMKALTDTPVARSYVPESKRRA